MSQTQEKDRKEPDKTKYKEIPNVAFGKKIYQERCSVCHAEASKLAGTTTDMILIALDNISYMKFIEISELEIEEVGKYLSSLE